MARLVDLPYELLLQILILSHNEELVTVCRWTYFCLHTTTPRICYKFVRQKGEWNRALVISTALRYKFLSTSLLDQISANRKELSTKPLKDGKKRKIDALEDIKIPNRLFYFDPQDAMPVNYIMSKRRKINKVESKGNQRRFDIVKRILALKVSVKGNRGNAGLLISAKAGNLTMVRLLLKRGADANAGNENKALLMAVVYGHLPIIRRLVKAGAPLTPLALRYAVQKKHHKVIEWLLKREVVPDMLTIKLLDKL